MMIEIKNAKKREREKERKTDIDRGGGGGRTCKATVRIWGVGGGMLKEGTHIIES